MQRLRIGRFSYSNLFPIFFMFDRIADAGAYEYVEGVPSTLNAMIRRGEIDISPSSSVEYLRHSDRYTLIDGHSISSCGPVGSIFLFSKRPLEALGGCTVLTTAQSETSVVLLEIVLRKFTGVEATLETSSATLESALAVHEAYLLIGDDALVRARTSDRFLRYDLGELWHRATGLPFVYALWIARRECCSSDPAQLARFVEDLGTAKQQAIASFREAAAASPLRGLLTEDELVAYWQGISYDFDEGHRRGLDLFKQYAEELGRL